MKPARLSDVLHLVLERLAGVFGEADPAVRQSGRAVVGSSLVALSVSLFAALVSLALGARADALVSLVFAVGALASLVAWRRTRWTRAVLQGAVASYLLVCLVAAVRIDVTWLVWSAVISIGAFYVGGLRTGLGWSVIALVTSLVAAGLADRPSWSTASLVRLLLLGPTLAALGGLYELSRRRMLEELEAARLAALDARDARGRLLARVSHEIRTPLNGVLGLSQSLLTQPLPDDVRRDLDLIRQSGTGLLAMINDLLDIARAEAGKLELHPSDVELQRLVLDVAALYRATADARGLRLEVQGVEPGPVWIRVDEVRLRQVLGNLIANAVKFTDTGSVTVRLTKGREASGLLEFAVSVEDTGSGIPPQGLERLFQPFTQVHSHNRNQGSGLGLAISRELAARLGGQLSAASTVGKGSVFTLLLTVERVDPPAIDRLMTPVPLPPFRALVVDDNELNRRVARALLTKLGGAVEEARDGKECLEAALAGRFSIILMDLQMPELDGYEATRLLRARGDTSPIIALTASAGPETEALCLAAGMNSVITKPLQFDLLRQRVAEALQARRAA
ncbi:MAG: response regulator [Myxococcaceae bacterium]|nr:response regulator [Myxococcaceae bacterium]